MKLEKGYFCTFEGTEGCGKSTHIFRAYKLLMTKGYDCLLTREPGGTEIGQRIRKILLDTRSKELDSLAELFLYVADRRQHVEEIIRPALDSKKIILSDRYEDSTKAYQGSGRDIDAKTIDLINNLATSGLKSDITFLLDGNPEVFLDRAKKRIENNPEEILMSRFEQEKLNFYIRARKGFLDLVKDEPKRIVIINAENSEEKVHKEIMDNLYNRLGI